jgi:hypothetical protein
MDVGTQDLVNTNTLTRHTDGAGVKVMAVVVASQVGGSTFRIIYTNQDGTSGRTSPTITTNTQGANGTIMTSPVQSGSLSSGLSGPFMPLEGNDTGVRSIEQVEFLTGDVGLLALVLVKPLASHSHFDVTAPTEVDFLINQNIMPVIKDDAYLNLIGYPAATVASNVLIGLIETVWI